MNSLLKNSISILLTLLVLIFFGIYLYNNPEILLTIYEINPIYILIIAILLLILFLFEALFIKLTLDIFHKPITIKESYLISVISRIGNYLLPIKVGTIFRAMYLKKKHNFEYSKFLSSLYAYYILLFLMYAALSLITLGIKYLNTGIYYPALTIFFMVLLIAILLVILLKNVKIKKFTNNKYIGKILDILNKFINSWNEIVKRRKTFFYLILITTGNILLNWIVTIVEFLSLGLKIDILNTLLYTCLSGVSLLISITPGSLGVREAVLLFTSESLQLSQEQIMQLALLDRSIIFVLLLILLIAITLFSKEFKLKDILLVKKESN